MKPNVKSFEKIVQFFILRRIIGGGSPGGGYGNALHVYLLK